MSKIKLLYLGNSDLLKDMEISSCVEYICEPDFTDKEQGNYDLAIINRQVSEEEKEFLYKNLKAYCLFVLESINLFGPLLWLYKSKKGKIIKYVNLQEFLLNDVNYYYPRPYGEKFHPESFSITQGFNGTVKWIGRYSVEINGQYGDDFQQIGFWKNNIPLGKDTDLDLWLEYQKDENVSIAIKIDHFYRGTSIIKETEIFDEKDLENIISVNTNENLVYLFISVLAKGKGNLKIIALHDRHSRNKHGSFLPGGKRIVANNREEVFFYFDPADMKPPLNVYFSGYKTAEGFEGYFMMRNMGCPFLLVSEARLRGGAFYLGNEEYESLIKNTIQEYIDELGFKNEDVIFSGLSMGTFGAAYYGCDIKPGSILLGKPLLSLGLVAANEKLVRPQGFPTSLDLVDFVCHDTQQENIDELNHRFWDKFEKTQWENTRFSIAYMIEDDYENQAYHNLISRVTDDKITIYGKGIHGRHNDESGRIVEWFVTQYKKIIKEDYRGLDYE